MDTNHNLNDVIISLQNKLANAELRASQFEAVAMSKDKKIKELEEQIKNLNEQTGDKH